jgi:hypothetical protein
MGKAKVAAARKLGIRLYITLRDQIDYAEFCRCGSVHAQSCVCTRQKQRGLSLDNTNFVRDVLGK